MQGLKTQRLVSFCVQKAFIVFLLYELIEPAFRVKLYSQGGRMERLWDNEERNEGWKKSEGSERRIVFGTIIVPSCCWLVRTKSYNTEQLSPEGGGALCSKRHQFMGHQNISSAEEKWSQRSPQAACLIIAQWWNSLHWWRRVIKLEFLRGSNEHQGHLEWSQPGHFSKCSVFFWR